MIKFIIAIVFLFPSLCYATPNINFVSGSTISLTGGGNKSSAAPKVWSTFESGVSTGWTFDGLPDAYLSWEVTGTAVNKTNSLYCLAKYRNDAHMGAAFNYVPQAADNTFYISYWQKLASNYPTNNQNNKFWRMGDQPTNGTNIVIGANLTMEKGIDNNNYVVEGSIPTLNVWHHYEILVEFPNNGNTDNYFTVYIDGVLKGTISDKWLSEGITTTPYMAFGSWYSTEDPDETKNGVGYFWIFDDIYVDTTLARVEIGNNKVYTSCTHKENQIPTSWSDTSITLSSYNNGSFVPGDRGYLFVIDSDGNASAGYDLGTLQSDGTWGNLKPVQATNLTMSNVTVGE